MTRTIVGLVVVSAIFCGAATLRSDEPSTSTREKTIARLEEKILEQQATIENLKIQIKMLQSPRKTLQPVPALKNPAPSKPVPDNWIPFDFDGAPVYIIPLGPEKNIPVRPAPTVR